MCLTSWADQMCSPRLLLSLQVLLDVSCGSGLFSRRFVGSKKFDSIVASDFSENMLKQAGNFFAKDLSLDGRCVPRIWSCHAAPGTAA